MSGLFDETDLWNVGLMRDELTLIRQGNPETIVLRRRINNVETTLEGQEFRVAETASSAGAVSVQQNEQATRWLIPITLLGTTTADIQSGDRFTRNGALYIVTGRLTRSELGVRAEAKLENNF